MGLKGERRTSDVSSKRTSRLTCRILRDDRRGVDSGMTALEQIQEISFQEKLRLMEAIWEQMSREECNWEVPRWHEEILNECERLLAEGDATFIDWEDAKTHIKAAVE